MIIRKIEEKDIQKLAKLMKSVYNEAPWNDEWTEESADKVPFSLSKLFWPYRL